jgi:hypothetical protein
MDIKHVVNATAVITLGKDMVFRDYVQGAYRMRGLGLGQKIHILIIPEVLEVMNRELKDCSMGSASEENALEKVAAWLIINSLKSEKIQWTMLCVQTIGNLYRKNAFRRILDAARDYTDDDNNKTKGIAEPTSSADTSAESDTKSALAVFKEAIDFSLEATVPEPKPFEEKLRDMLVNHDRFINSSDQEIGHK